MLNECDVNEETKIKIKTHLRYPDPNYNNRVNYYSNPSVNFGSIPTGDSNNNNAQLLIQRRFLMSAVGNEATTCSVSGLKFIFLLNILDEFLMGGFHL